MMKNYLQKRYAGRDNDDSKYMCASASARAREILVNRDLSQQI